MGFSRQEYWSGLPCPSPEDLDHENKEKQDAEPSCGQMTKQTVSPISSLSAVPIQSLTSNVQMYLILSVGVPGGLARQGQEHRLDLI